jgi:hypothetical protein
VGSGWSSARRAPSFALRCYGVAQRRAMPTLTQIKVVWVELSSTPAEWTISLSP